MSEKVAELESLLDLFEKHFNGPSALVQVTDTCGRPLHIVGNECHQHGLAVNLDPCSDSSESLGVLGACCWILKDNFIVTCNISLALADALAAYPDAHAILGSGDPKYAFI